MIKEQGLHFHNEPHIPTACTIQHNKEKSSTLKVPSLDPELRTLLEELLDIEGTCDHLDHHGYCQTHYVQDDCIVKRIREYVDKF